MRFKRSDKEEDIDMPMLGCADFGLDFVDHAGDQQLDVADNIRKVPLPGITGKRRRGSRKRERERKREQGE